MREKLVNVSPEKLSQVIVEYYNYLWDGKVLEIDQVPPNKLAIIMSYNYLEILKPLVNRDYLKGVDRGAIARKYQITNTQVKNLARSNGHLKRRPTRKRKRRTISTNDNT